MHRTARLALAAWHILRPGAWPSPLARLLDLTALHRSRRSLARLDDHLLRDVGLTRREALREARRPAWDGARDRPWQSARARSWDAPSHWFADKARGL